MRLLSIFPTKVQGEGKTKIDTTMQYAIVNQNKVKLLH